MADVDASIPKGTITGRFSRLLADSQDVGTTPDMAPLSGVVLIEPLVALVRWPGILPTRMMVYETLTCPLNSDGELCAPGTQDAGVVVIATDQPDGQPDTVQYRATFKLEGVKANPAPVVFSVPTNGTVDLVAVVPETPVPGTVQVLVDDSSKLDVADLDAAMALHLADPDSLSRLAMGMPTFIQDTVPVGVAGAYAWWDTSGPGDPVLWIEDGA